MRHQYDLYRFNSYATVGKVKSDHVMRSCQSVMIESFFLFFTSTEQLPYLGGLYHQGRQTAVAAQVRACFSACVCVFLCPLLIEVDIA